MKVSQDQFAEYMNDRLRMLIRSCEAYDLGDYAEAVRLAGSIVKLVGDRTKKSGDTNKNFVSLSTRLGIKPSHMVDLSLHGAMDQQHLHGPLCVLGLHLSGASGLVPWLDGFPTHSKRAPSRITFDQWWTEPVIRDCFGNEFSRQIIIETMRDQEDAHTDGDLLPHYAAMAYSGAIGIRAIEPKGVRLDENPARVAARQIAHEVLRTFVPDLPTININTRGLQVSPVMLYEVFQEDSEGNFQQVLDHKAIEFRAENTSSPEVWAEWQKFVRPAPSTNPTPAVPIDLKTKNWVVRVAFLNYAPYPIQGVQAMVSMQHAPG